MLHTLLGLFWFTASFFLQYFCGATKAMLGGNYPTLSSSMYTYAALIIHVEDLKKDP